MKFIINWPDAYIHLVAEKIDNARIKIEHVVKDLEIKLIAPDNNYFKEVSFLKLKPKITISNENGMLIVTIKGKNVPPGHYTYDITLI